MDIEFVGADDDRLRPIYDDNCFNSTNIGLAEESNDGSDGDDENLAPTRSRVSLGGLTAAFLVSWVVLGY